MKHGRVLREKDDPRWESGKIKPDDGKRDLGELFDEAPSEESYPEYHVIVKNIMDLKTVKRKVRSLLRSQNSLQKYSAIFFAEPISCA